MHNVLPPGPDIFLLGTTSKAHKMRKLKNASASIRTTSITILPIHFLTAFHQVPHMFLTRFQRQSSPL